MSSIEAIFCKRCPDYVQLSQGTTGDYFCGRCGWNTAMKDENEMLGSKFELLEAHAKKVQELVDDDSKTVRLLIGPNEDALSFPRSILSFYSGFFDKSSHCPLSPSQNKSFQIKLPDDDWLNMKIFGYWAQTGVLCIKDFYDKYTVTPPSDTIIRTDLLILGARLHALKFNNAVMHDLLDLLEGQYMFAVDAEYIYAKTTRRDSKIRQVVVDAVQSEGPLSLLGDAGSYRDGWFDSIAKGGELMQACVIAGGLHNIDRDRHPSRIKNRMKHMEDEERGGRVREVRELAVESEEVAKS